MSRSNLRLFGALSLVCVLAACGAAPRPNVVSAGATAGANAVTRDARADDSPAPARAAAAAVAPVDDVSAGAPDGAQADLPPKTLTTLRTTHALPIAAILKSLKKDYRGATRVLLVGVSDPLLVKALVARGDRLDVFEADDSRFAAAELAARKKLFRCKSMPTELTYHGEYRRYRGIVPCHDEHDYYGVIVVDCMRGEQSLSCAQGFVDPDRVALGAAMYVAFSVDHHVSVQSPFWDVLAFRTATGFDVLALPPGQTELFTDGAEMSIKAQPPPGPDVYETRRGRFYGCLGSKRERRSMPFRSDDRSVLVPPQIVIANQAGIDRTSPQAAQLLREELLVSAEVGPECYALWSYDARSEVVHPPDHPAQRNLTFMAMHDDVRPYQMLRTIAAYAPHVEAAIVALRRSDIDTAITELEKASSIFEAGLGNFAIHTFRGFLVKELAYELSWARAHHRATDYARALVRFWPYVDRAASRPLENALVHAVAEFAHASINAAPVTPATHVARYQIDSLWNQKLAKPAHTPPRQDWLEGRSDYPDYANDRMEPVSER